MTEYELKLLYETMKPREVDYFKVKELLSDELTPNIFTYTPPLYGGQTFFAYRMGEPIPSEAIKGAGFGSWVKRSGIIEGLGIAILSKTKKQKGTKCQ